MTGEFSSYIAAAFRLWTLWTLVLHCDMESFHIVTKSLRDSREPWPVYQPHDLMISNIDLHFLIQSWMFLLFLSGFFFWLVFRSGFPNSWHISVHSCSVVNTYCVYPFCFVRAFAFILILLCGLQIKLQTHLANNIDNNNGTKPRSQI